MGISLLISGNLTGFGRFYTSPSATELLGNDKISLDNHSHLTFLGNNEKAYSITFMPRFIALSQYTQILDSFRRPGKLVVTLLLPRNYIIVPNYGSPKGAAYSLINKISDKFFEKNFLDGMINQNPAVLGQDYYSEILDEYSLKVAECRKINLDPAPTKKIGYVKAMESDMPNYLDTPYRKSYGDGNYNLVFFAPSAPIGTPNSIDEEPEEVVFYRVRILNTGAMLPNPVRLSAPLYKIQARPGEKPFPIEGTYKDAIEHLLEPRITGRIVPEDIIEIQYNFEKEEKTIRFVFVDIATSKPISLDFVLPSIVFSDGSRQPLSSETFTFRGSEIYEDKRLVSDNNAVSINARSERLDLSRLTNGQEYKIYVQQGFDFTVDYIDNNITYTFVNVKTRQNLQFANPQRIHLEGSPSDWNVYVETSVYSAPMQPLRIENGRFRIGNIMQKRVPVSSRIPQSDRHHETVSSKQPVNSSSSQVNLSSSPDKVLTPHKKHKNKWLKFIYIIPVLLIAIGYAMYILYAGKKEPAIEGDGGKDNPSKMTENLQCYITYHFLDNKELTEKDYSSFKYIIFDGENDLGEDFLKEEFVDSDGKSILKNHEFTPQDYAQDKYYICVIYIPENVERDDKERTIELSKTEITKNDLDNKKTIQLELDVTFEQLKWYKELCDKLNSEKAQKQYKKDQKTWENRVHKIKNHNYKILLQTILDKLNQSVSEADKPKIEPESAKNIKPSKQDLILLDSPDVTINDLNKISPNSDNYQITTNVTVIQRKNAIINVLKCINGKTSNNGKVTHPGDNIINQLSTDQKYILNKALQNNVIGEDVRKEGYKSISDFYNWSKI